MAATMYEHYKLIGVPRTMPTRALGEVLSSLGCDLLDRHLCGENGASNVVFAASQQNADQLLAHLKGRPSSDGFRPKKLRLKKLDKSFQLHTRRSSVVNIAVFPRHSNHRIPLDPAFFDGVKDFCICVIAHAFGIDVAGCDSEYLENPDKGVHTILLDVLCADLAADVSDFQQPLFDAMPASFDHFGKRVDVLLSCQQQTRKRRLYANPDVQTSTGPAVQCHDGAAFDATTPSPAASPKSTWVHDPYNFM